MSSPQDIFIDPRHYIRLFWRRKGVILLCTVVAFCSALIGLEFIPAEYDSTATILIEDRDRVSSELRRVMGGMRQTDGGYRADEKRLSKIVGRIRSRPFLERVVKLLRMDEDPAVIAEARQAVLERPGTPLEEVATRIVVSELRKKVSIAHGGSGIYWIRVFDYSPQNAQLLAKWISELFVDVSAQNSLDELKTAHEFGAEQLKIYEEQLRRSERALEQYKQSMIEQDFSKSVVRTDNVTMAETLYQRVLDEAELARLRILPFARTLSGTNLDAEKLVLADEPRIRNQGRGLATALQEELTDRLLAGREVGEWPPGGAYVSLRRGLIQLIERTADDQYPNASPEAREALVRHVFSTMDHEAYADAAEYLGQEISDFKREAQSEPRGQMELARYEAEVRTNRDLLRSFQAQLVASDISQAMEMTNLGMRIEILDPPQVPLEPARPARAKILLAALMMGPLMGAGIAFGTELMDSTLRSLTDFQRVFSGPVLGTTPLVSRVQQKPGRVRKYWVPATVTGILLLTVVFFLARDTILGDVIHIGAPVQVVEPEVITSP